MGKSTLLNAILGEKIAITTPKPQTTRNRIMGIKNLPNGQLIFVDTPGIHEAKNPLGQAMVAEARAVFSSVDVIVITVEAHRGLVAGDKAIIKAAEEASLPLVLALNKKDLASPEQMREMIARASELTPFSHVFPICAVTGEGVEELIETIKNLLPEGPAFFPPDMITDRSERFLAAEIIREKVMLYTHQELPYSTAVTVETFQEDEQRNLITIEATITVERPSQKKIIIGAGGALLKKIGTLARLELEKFFATRVFLSLFVRVRRDWTREEKWIKEFGYKT